MRDLLIDGDQDFLFVHELCNLLVLSVEQTHHVEDRASRTDRQSQFRLVVRQGLEQPE